MSTLKTVNKLLKFENLKLRNQLIFTLPASKEVCGRICPGCYAVKAQVRFPKTVNAYRNRMYETSLEDDFVQKIKTEILQIKNKKNVEAVRIHESGDFYSQSYIDKWCKIAKELPEVSFYAFTKRKRDFDFSEIEALPNIVIIDSLKFNKLNYGPYEEMLALKAQHGAMICPATYKGASKDTCGVTCSWCWSKKAQQFGTVFIQH